MTPAHGMDRAKMPEVMPQETVLPRASQKQTATIQKQPIQAPSTVRATGDTASVTATISRLTQVSTIRIRIKMRKARSCRRKPPRRSYHSRRTGAPSRFNEDAAGRSVEGDTEAAGGAWVVATGAGLAGCTGLVVGCAGFVAVACAGISPYCPDDAGTAAGAGGTAPAGTPPGGATRPYPGAAVGPDEWSVWASPEPGMIPYDAPDAPPWPLGPCAPGAGATDRPASAGPARGSGVSPPGADGYGEVLPGAAGGTDLGASRTADPSSTGTSPSGGAGAACRPCLGRSGAACRPCLGRSGAACRPPGPSLLLRPLAVRARHISLAVTVQRPPLSHAPFSGVTSLLPIG